MMRGKGKQIERVHGGAGVIEPQFRVEAAGEPARILGAAEKQVGEQGLATRARRQKHAKREEHAENAGAGEALPARGPEKIPGEPARGAGEHPQRDGEQEDGQPVQPIAIGLARRGIADIAVDGPRRKQEMQQHDDRIDAERREQARENHESSLVERAKVATAARRDSMRLSTKRATLLTAPGTTTGPRPSAASVASAMASASSVPGASRLEAAA